MPKELLAEIASVPELGSTSESEQMYLITVARVAEAGDEGPVSISKIADTLGVSVPSANEMVRKLDNRGLLTYEPYHGVLLSDVGHRIANQVLRTRRLWATFLVQHLGLSPAAADEQACHLEHSTFPEAAERLASFLGNPAAGPLGRPIPAAGSPDTRRLAIHLTDLAVGVVAEVVSVGAPDRAATFLAAEGLVIGRRVRVAASGSSGLLVDICGDLIQLDEQVAATIAVHPEDTDPVPIRRTDESA